MSTPHADVDDAARLARVKLSSAIEPGDLRVTGLVSELGAGKVLDYLEAAGEVENHWGFTIGHELAHVDPGKVLEQAADRGIRFVIPGDAEWPDQLGALRDAGALHERGGVPVGLWVRGAGDLRRGAADSVAVVGSRAATSYGLELASDLGRDLASMGQTVISGAAYGIDQAAHRGAVVAGGSTIALIPCGADRAYPTAHAQLLDTIAQRGLVVSEGPPGTTPTGNRFLARNRITAALAEGTVVVEAAVRSGAMNSAHWTANLHRPVMGMPGPVTSVASAGVHQLIRLGEATMVTNAQEVLTRHHHPRSRGTVCEGRRVLGARPGPPLAGTPRRGCCGDAILPGPIVRNRAAVDNPISVWPPPTLLVAPKEALPMIDTTIDPPSPPAGRVDWMWDVSVERILDSPPDLLGLGQPSPGRFWLWARSSSDRQAPGSAARVL